MSTLFLESVLTKLLRLTVVRLYARLRRHDRLAMPPFAKCCQRHDTTMVWLYTASNQNEALQRLDTG